MEEFSHLLEQNLGISPDVQVKLLNSLIVLLVVFVIYQVIVRSVIQRMSDLRTRYLWKKTLGYVFFVIAVLIIVQFWLEGAGSLATYLGLLSAGLAIALRDPITDIIGWVFIMLRRPLEVGDRVEIGGVAGDVIDQGIFQFTMMEIGNWVDAEQSTGRLLHLPNALVFNSILANYTKGLKYIWNEIPVMLSFDSDWEKAKGLLEEIAGETIEVPEEDIEHALRRLSNRYMFQSGKLTPIVYTSVKDQGILITLRYLCEPRKRRDSSHILWEKILRAFAQHPDIRFVNQEKATKAAAEQVEY
jgi:small-conductance mechanosensitive channel